MIQREMKYNQKLCADNLYTCTDICDSLDKTKSETPQG